MDLQPYQSEPFVSQVSTSSSPFIMSLDQCILAWLDEKHGKSESDKTHAAYRHALNDFRATLQSVGVDLDAPASLIAPLLQGWCGVSKREGAKVTAATYNQRAAIISSFYRYAIKHEVLTINPVERIERRDITQKDAAHPLEAQNVKVGLQSIDRKTLQGKRDYALLSLALVTARRVSELANLRMGDLQRQGSTTRVVWTRCKGNKRMEDTLQTQTTKALYSYLEALYGKDLSKQAKDAPVWVSFSDRCKDQALGTRTLQRICDEHLGTSKMHATRHTWAVNMAHSGASLAEIGKGLGHRNLKTTSDYLDEHLGHENKYASTLEGAFGI